MKHLQLISKIIGLQVILFYTTFTFIIFIKTETTKYPAVQRDRTTIDGFNKFYELGQRNLMMVLVDKNDRTNCLLDSDYFVSS